MGCLSKYSAQNSGSRNEMDSFHALVWHLKIGPKSNKSSESIKDDTKLEKH